MAQRNNVNHFRRLWVLVAAAAIGVYAAMAAPTIVAAQEDPLYTYDISQLSPIEFTSGFYAGGSIYGTFTVDCSVAGCASGTQTLTSVDLTVSGTSDSGINTTYTDAIGADANGIEARNGSNDYLQLDFTDDFGVSSDSVSDVYDELGFEVPSNSPDADLFVPEPMSLTLFATALAGLGTVRRRKRRPQAFSTAARCAGAVRCR